VLLQGGLGQARDLPGAANWTRRAAAGGVASAQLQLGACHERGDMVQLDIGEARRYYELAAAQGQPRALFSLGRLTRTVQTGGGAQPDSGAAARLAFQLYERAAHLGDADAQVSVANCRRYGQGCDVDFAQAFAWSRRAADQDSGTAMMMVGLMYATGGPGRGVDRDEAQAAVWFARSAARGEERALRNLRTLAAEGVEQANVELRKLGYL
jgi:hypothetical protein